MSDRVIKQSSPSTTLLSESPLTADPVDLANPTNALSSVAPEPIYVSREQSSGMMTKSGLSALQHTINSLNVFQHLPRDSAQGVEDLTRMKMAMLSGIPTEVNWALKKYLAYSNKAPYMISLKENRYLLPLFAKLIVDTKPVLKRFDMPLNAENDIPTLQRCLNTILVLRNMAQDAESTQILAVDSTVKDFILTVLQMSNAVNKAAFSLYSQNSPFFNELIHYIIDLMEAISSYIAPARKDDPFFQNMVSLLTDTNDRYMVISILRSLSRLLVRSKADEESAADNLHNNILDQIVSYLLVDCDSELVMASLDFLYQYVLPGNERINTLLRSEQRFAILSAVLPKLLTYGVTLPDYEVFGRCEIKLKQRVRPPAPTEPPKLDKSSFHEVLELNEPMRSTAWLRCCFEPVQDSEVTQISLWRGYESEFSQAVKESGRKLLPAVEFIKNVSNAFKDASAMVITDQTTSKKRFVIKGIQPRSFPVSISAGEVAANTSVDKASSSLETKNGTLREASQTALPGIKFPSRLTDVSKASATFLCLISNDDKGLGFDFCRSVRSVILFTLAHVPPLNSALAEYVDNIPAT
ncbi:LANO_0B08218g1_1 [Lachancea nothofagi CBS 11611]|uniref:LANO_0B08218g1_1 n=1 Tax=Lachancea nothofagi CBS 11611 TaxID=1266666 RepID=A0A1G4J0G1_9SACH|nr:LANO_0B08218g1_1 [Lachancea nothofagi CBS 11611]